MEQINTLLDTSKAQDQHVLPEELKILYGGDLRFPEFLNPFNGPTSERQPQGELYLAVAVSL